MRVSAVALAILLLTSQARAFTVTMPSDAPVTLSFDDLKRSSGREERTPRESRERTPREYREPSPGAGSTDPVEALKALGLILAAPVIIVGGSLYIGGVAAADWFVEQRRQREAQRLREEELRRLSEEDKRRLESVLAELESRSGAGRSILYEALGAILDAGIETAEAAEAGAYVYATLSLETHVSGKIYTRQNEFNAEILAAYKEFWADPEYRAVLSLVTPLHFKGIMAWESEFQPQMRWECGFRAKRCLGRTETWLQGVGIMSKILINATDPKGAALRVDKKVDERLDPAKAIRGAIRTMRLIHEKIIEVHRNAKTVPSAEALREFTMVGYNIGWNKTRRILLSASKTIEKPLGDIRFNHLLADPRGIDMLKKTLNTKGQLNKFEKETRGYLSHIQKWIDDARRSQRSRP